MTRRALVFLALAMALSARPGAAANAAESPEPATRVELWTMGMGEDVFERFGHGALCVFEEPEADGLCYNYGTTNFKNPADLVLRFLKHEAKFWVSVASSSHTRLEYGREDRTIWIQRLPLSEGQARALADRLAHDARPENREYIYDHFLDNCTTRLRDHIDAVLEGKLRVGEDRPYGPTWRELVRKGFSGEPWMLALTELLLGRFTDQHPTRWEATFHPDVLREVVEERLGVKPIEVATRKGPALTGARTAGQRWLIFLAIGLAALAGLLVATGKTVPRRLALLLVALVLGTFAVVVYLLAFYWKIRYLHGNEVVAVLVPSDLALAVIHGRTLRTYLNLRLFMLVACVALVLTGVFVQPLVPVIVLAGLPLLILRVGAP
jgi:Domain of unknown function (DUF4105)